MFASELEGDIDLLGFDLDRAARAKPQSNTSS
jgi:hypothetical protein